METATPDSTVQVQLVDNEISVSKRCVVARLMIPGGQVGGAGPPPGSHSSSRPMYPSTSGVGPGGMGVAPMLPGGGLSLHPHPGHPPSMSGAMAAPSVYMGGARVAGGMPSASGALGTATPASGPLATSGGMMGMGMGGLAGGRPAHAVVGGGGPAGTPVLMASGPMASSGAGPRLVHPGMSVAHAPPHGRAHSDPTPYRPHDVAGVAREASEGAPQFTIQNEHFPALSGDAPAPAATPANGGTDAGVGGGAAGGGGAAAVSGVGGGAAAAAAATAAGVAGGPRFPPGGAAAMPPAERYGLMGLLHVIRLTDRDVSTLALGTDLTSLGLNLNSPESLYATFGSPWADSPGTRDPQFTLPTCYSMSPPALKTGHLSKFLVETLFYIFYGMPRDVLQAYAAQELYSRNWVYHTEYQLWFTSHPETLFAAGAPPESYVYFDTAAWERRVFKSSVAGLTAGFLSEEDAKVKFS